MSLEFHQKSDQDVEKTFDLDLIPLDFIDPLREKPFFYHYIRYFWAQT